MCTTFCSRWCSGHHLSSTSTVQQAYGATAAAQVAVYPIDPWTEHRRRRRRGRRGGKEARGSCDEEYLNTSRKPPSRCRRSPRTPARRILRPERSGWRDPADDRHRQGPFPTRSPMSRHLRNPANFTRSRSRSIVSLHLQYREHYTTVDLSKPLAEKKDVKNAPAPDSDFHAAVDPGVIPRPGLLFDLRVTPSPAPAKPGDLRWQSSQSQAQRQAAGPICADVRSAAGEVTLVDGPDGTRRSLEFDAAYGVVAYGEDREKLNVVRELVNFTLKPEWVEHFVKNPFRGACAD